LALLENRGSWKAFAHHHHDFEIDVDPVSTTVILFLHLCISRQVVEQVESKALEGAETWRLEVLSRPRGCREVPCCEL
jgi:hypothetical protein